MTPHRAHAPGRHTLAGLILCAWSTLSTLAATFPEALPSSTLHNFFQLSPRVFSGSSPDTDVDAAFADLRKRGITTIVSVDGARPDVEAARRHGLRYFHLPIGYDGIAPERRAQLMKAAQSSPGAVYVHCHHGKHRGPSAAAVLCQFSAGWSTNQAVAWLHQAGTAPDYPGLYRSVAQFTRPDDATLAAVPPLPEVAITSTLVESMVALDAHLDHLKAAQGAHWNHVPGHPDLAPRHEATQVWEHFRELRRHPESSQRPADYQQALADSEQAAEALRAALAPPRHDVPKADLALRSLSALCVSCHKTHRN